MSGFREIRVPEAIYTAIIEKRLWFFLSEADPPIALGDILKLREWSSVRGEFTGRVCYVQVTFLIGDPLLGLRVGFVAFQFKIKILTERLKT